MTVKICWRKKKEDDEDSIIVEAETLPELLRKARGVVEPLQPLALFWSQDLKV